jgi:hypothetical protein
MVHALLLLLIVISALQDGYSHCGYTARFCAVVDVQHACSRNALHVLLSGDFLPVRIIFSRPNLKLQRSMTLSALIKDSSLG